MRVGQICAPDLAQFGAQISREGDAARTLSLGENLALHLLRTEQVHSEARTRAVTASVNPARHIQPAMNPLTMLIDPPGIPISAPVMNVT